jgi:tetratricopeptide (TPR) repeat protein
VLDANKVMGFPLVASGGVPQTTVEQVEEAVAAAMQDTDPLRWMRARLFLGADRRAGLPADSATRLARRRGARYWLGGSLAFVGESLIVRLELFDAQGDSLVGSRSETGPRATPGYALAFRAVNSLLPKVVGRSTHVAQKYLEAHPPAAVAKWLAGEVAYRNARYADAMRLYREALAADSSLAPAALKGAMTAGWLNDYPVGDSLIRLALARLADLPPINRVFARALSHQFAGNGDSALAGFREVVRVAPEWSEGWYGVGEASYHLWPEGANLDSLARDAFHRSTELDPDFAPVVFHLAELTIVAGMLDEAERLVTRHGSLSADTVQQVQLELMLECVRNGPGSVNWTHLAWRDRAGGQLLGAGRLLAAGGRHLECAEGAYRAGLVSPAPDPDFSRRWTAALGLHHLFIARGEYDRAHELADSVAASGVAAGRGLLVLEALLGSGSDSAGKAEMAALEIPVDSMGVQRLWWFGEWSAAHGEMGRLDAVVRRLRALADGSRDPAHTVPARAMAARLLLLRADTAAAIDSLLAIRPVAPLTSLIWDYWPALGPERLLGAQLLLAHDRPEEALRLAESFDGSRAALDVAYLAPSLELRRRAAVQMEDRQRAEVYVRRLAALRSSRSP